MAEDGFGFIGVVAQNAGVADDSALDVVDLDGAGISRRHWCDVGNEFGFIEGPAFLVGEDAVVSEIFFPRRLVAGHDGVVKLLGATDEFVPGDRYICAAGERGYEDDDEQKFHNAKQRGKGELGRKS